jgi:CRISPR/Cas system-associated endoribonuclease Cas2
MSRVAYVVAYDIADDERREDVAMFLIRPYCLTPEAMNERLIHGARRIEERTDFWIA